MSMVAVGPETGRVLYSFRDVDYLAGSRPGTTRRWLSQFPDLSPTTDEGMSFYGGIQMAAVARLRRAGLSINVIQNMLTYLREEMGFEYPFLTEKFLVGGKQAFLDRADTLIEVGRTRGQLCWGSVMRPFLDELDYDDLGIDCKVAGRWWPIGKDHFVLVSPEYGYGLPVVAGTFVRTEVLANSFALLGSIAQVAKDFDLPEEAVERALQFEQGPVFYAISRSGALRQLVVRHPDTGIRYPPGPPPLT